MSQVALMGKNPPANVGDARDVGSVPESGRFSGEGNGCPLQYSCLGNSVGYSPWGGKGRRGLSTAQGWARFIPFYAVGLWALNDPRLGEIAYSR